MVEQLFWKGSLPIKVKCSLWFTLDNNILTQDNFQNRGGTIVNFCCPCNTTLESLDHLFVDHSFPKVVWWKTVPSLQLDYCWGMVIFQTLCIFGLINSKSLLGKIFVDWLQSYKLI